MWLNRCVPCLGVVVMLAGCAGLRPVVPPGDWPARQQRLEADNVLELERGNLALAARLKQEIDDYREKRRPTMPVLNYLALSGGADYGAFGTGVLVGWGKSAASNLSRPDFDIVTGISIGAFIAPYAFVGTDDACNAADRVFRNPKKDWVVFRDLFFWLPQPLWESVTPSSIETALRVSTAQQINLMAAEMSILNLTGQAKIELRMIAIPSQWRAHVKGTLQKETMNELADLGAKMGADPKSWQLLTTPTVDGP